MWRIKHWDAHFENNKSRTVADARWVPIPNKQDGDGYLTLIESADGLACYGAFVAIVLLASKCNPRGTLIQSNRVPHTPETIARKTHCPAALILKTLQRCSTPGIDWIEWMDDAQAADLFTDGDAPLQRALGCPSGGQAGAAASSGSGSGIESSSSASSPAGAIGFVCTDEGEPTHWCTAEDQAELKRLFSQVDVGGLLAWMAGEQQRDVSKRRTLAKTPSFIRNVCKNAPRFNPEFVQSGALSAPRTTDKGASKARQWVASSIATGAST